MEKNWFILEEGQHKGPFSSPELVDFFVNGKITEADMLWKDGEDDWKPLREFEEVMTMIEFQGTSLDINVSDVDLAKYRNKKSKKHMAQQQAKAKAELLKHSEELDQTEPPPLPDLPTESEDELPAMPMLPEEEAPQETAQVEAAQDVEQVLNEEPITEAPQEESLPPNTAPDIKKKNLLLPLKKLSTQIRTALSQITGKQWAMTFVSFTFLIVSLSFAFKGNDWDQWIINYPKPLQEKFLKTLKHKDGLRGDFFWDFSEKKLYGVINRGGTGIIEVEFRAIKNKILGKELAIIKAKGRIEKNQISFDAIEFEAGLEILPGHYTYTFKGHQSSVLINLVEYFDYKGLAGFEKNLESSGESIFYESSEELFTEALTRFNAKKKARELRPLQELLQQYKTFFSLLSELNNTYQVHLDTIKTGSQIKRFERQYMEKIGPLLQGLILDNYRTKDQLNEKNLEQANMYTQLISYGKNITSLAVEMSRKTKGLGKLKEEMKNELLTTFSVKVEALKLKGKVRIDQFTEKVAELNAL